MVDYSVRTSTMLGATSGRMRNFVSPRTAASGDGRSIGGELTSEQRDDTRLRQFVGVIMRPC